MLLYARFSDPAFVDRFHSEAAAAAHLEHPNIVPIYEVGRQDGQPFYSMRLIEGCNLAHELTHGPMTPEGAVNLIATLARAVHYAHQRGVLHRDLKPHNILLDREGQPYLADFGLAKLLGLDSDSTLSTSVVGSPAYMAPEQAAGGTRPLTTAVDVYGLGAVLYAAITGKPPFAGDTPLEVMRKASEEEPLPPSQALKIARGENRAYSTSALRTSSSAIDRDLETICLKCLQKNPAMRYGSAEALAEDLECWRRREPIRARRVSQAERAWLWCRRHPIRAGLVISLL
jgi:serine/threonine-protein kinase